MATIPICNLKPFQHSHRIIVRVCRIWRPRAFGSDHEFYGLQCILVDQMEDAIQANIKEIDYDSIAAKIEPGALYEITHFHTAKAKESFKVVPHDATINFNARTIFKKLTNVGPKIPRHRFFLLDYSQLSSRIDNTTILTDVLGRITAIQQLEEKLIGNTRIEQKRDIFIQNIRRDEIRMTLWSDSAINFNHEALQQLAPPVFVVFTSLKVKEYQRKPVLSSTVSTLSFINPDIPELQSFKIAFAHSTAAIHILSPSTLPQLQLPQLQAAEKLSIAALNVLNPDKCRDATIMCRATITRFDARRGWWYKACPSCYKQLKAIPHNDKLICPKHSAMNPVPLPWFKISLILEDDTDAANVMIIGKPAEQLFGISCYNLVVEQGFVDQTPFPEPILRLRGQKKLFHLRFGTMRADSNKNDLLIQTVFDDELPLLQSTHPSSDQQLVAHAQIDVPQQKLLASPPPASTMAPITPISSSEGALPKSPALIPTKKVAARKLIYSSLTQARKKLKSHAATPHTASQATIENEAAAKDVFNSDNLPLSAFKIKTATEKSTVRKEIESALEDKKKEKSTLQEPQEGKHPIPKNIKTADEAEHNEQATSTNC